MYNGQMPFSIIQGGNMKNEIRQHYKHLRQNLSPASAEEKSRLIKNNLFSQPLWQEAQRIMCYLSFKQEVATHEIIQGAWQQKKQVIIPVCKPNSFEIIPSVLNSFADLEPKTMGILEPKEDKLAPVDPLTIDLCLIPGLAFDLLGHRIGFGAGYYDRFLPQLKKHTPKIALAYGMQLSSIPLPADKHDIKMDYIITEDNIYSIE